jgi:hypothetical protein
VLFLSNVVKAQGSMFSDGVDEQPETRKFGGTLVLMPCCTALLHLNLFVAFTQDIYKNNNNTKD